MSNKERLSLSFVLLFGLLLLALDIYEDLHEGVSWVHVAEEGLILLSFLIVFVYIWARFLMKKAKVKRITKELETAQGDAAFYRQEVQILSQGISDKIDQEMKRWAFTEAEVEIGFLLLKGLSSKEIASIRDCSEATIRQHLNHMYKKSGLTNRNGFLSYFLEDLFVIQP